MNTRDAVIAARRFGLGARQGELRAIAADPRGWLVAQLAPEQPLPGPIRALPGTADDQVAFFRWLRDYQADARRAAGGGAGREAMAAGGAVNVEQSYVKALLPHYAAAVQARFRTAVETDTPFRERLVRFWSNHFVVSPAKPAAIALPASYEKDVARRFVTGRFADMLLAAEKHPAMLLFLDNAQSIGPNSRWGREPARIPANALGERPAGLNENLAREILELHTLGVQGGYTQADVTALARVITGWQIANPFRQVKLKRFSNWTAEDFFHFNADAHEPGPQVVLGRRYPQEGADQGEVVLRDLAAHPSTARFLATKLARHFAADVPPAALVERLAARFLETGGDLREVAISLVHSPEPWQVAVPPAPAAGKFMPPEDHVVAVLRALGGPPMTGIQLVTLLGELGQRPWWPSGPDGWKDIEGEWLAPDALWKRLEFVSLAGRAMARGAVPPLDVAEQALGEFLAADTRAAMRAAESPAQALALLLLAPEFLRR